MSAAAWYVLPTSCLPGCNSSFGRSQPQLAPQQAGPCLYPSINDINRSSSASSYTSAVVHGDWAVPLPLSDSASSNITSGGSYAGGSYGFSESGAAYVGMFGMQPAGHAAAAAMSAAVPLPQRDTIADVLALLGADDPSATASSTAATAEEDVAPVLPRRSAKAGCCPPTPVRPRPAIALVPAAELIQHNGLHRYVTWQ